MRTPSMKRFNVNVDLKGGDLFLFGDKDVVCPKAKIQIIKQED